MSLLRILGLLVAFGITLAIYTVWVITVGGVNAVQFVVVWAAIFFASRATLGVSYIVALAGALILAFPISIFIYLPQRGGIQFADGGLLFKQLRDPKTYVMVCIYIVALCGSVYLLRSQRSTGK